MSSASPVLSNVTKWQAVTNPWDAVATMKFTQFKKDSPKTAFVDKRIVAVVFGTGYCVFAIAGHLVAAGGKLIPGVVRLIVLPMPVIGKLGQKIPETWSLNAVVVHLAKAGAFAIIVCSSEQLLMSLISPEYQLKKLSQFNLIDNYLQEREDEIAKLKAPKVAEEGKKDTEKSETSPTVTTPAPLASEITTLPKPPSPSILEAPKKGESTPVDKPKEVSEAATVLSTPLPSTTNVSIPAEIKVAGTSENSAPKPLDQPVVPSDTAPKKSDTLEPKLEVEKEVEIKEDETEVMSEDETSSSGDEVSTPLAEEELEEETVTPVSEPTEEKKPKTTETVSDTASTTPPSVLKADEVSETKETVSATPVSITDEGKSDTSNLPAYKKLWGWFTNLITPDPDAPTIFDLVPSPSYLSTEEEHTVEESKKEEET